MVRRVARSGSIQNEQKIKGKIGTEEEEENADEDKDIITLVDDAGLSKAECLAYLEDVILAISQGFEAGARRAAWFGLVV